MEEDKFARTGDMPPPITVRVSDTAWTIHYPVFVLDGDEGWWEYPTLVNDDDPGRR